MKNLNPSFSLAPIASLNAFFRLFARSSRVEQYSSEGLLGWRTPIPHPWFNGVMISRPPGNDESTAIQRMQAFFATRGVTAYTWWPEDGIDSAPWASQLLPKGFIEDRNTPGMAADLAALPASIPTPAGFTIEPVTNAGMLADWMVTFCRGFGLPEAWIQPFQDLMSPLGWERPLRYYLGFLDGAPVAASTLFLDASSAGIYNVAVLETARGKGLGAAFTLAPLLEARSMGYTLGALQSSGMGFRVYQRLGFQKTCDMTHFYWSTPDN